MIIAMAYLLAFLAIINHLSISELQDSILVAGYPTGGDSLSITKVSSITAAYIYPLSAHLIDHLNCSSNFQSFVLILGVCRTGYSI